MENDFISIYKEWITIESYQFKVLILANVLENNSLAYYGNYTAMCNWLRISSSTENRKNLQKAVKTLKENELIQLDVKSKNKFVITLTDKAKTDTRVVEIKKQWIEVLKDYNIDIKKNKRVNKNWDTMLKLMVEICYRIEEAQKNNWLFKKGIVVTSKELAKEIGRCESTTGTILKKLKECNFLDGFSVDKKLKYDVVTTEDGEIYIYCKGMYITAQYDWETPSLKAEEQKQ